MFPVIFDIVEGFAILLIGVVWGARSAIRQMGLTPPTWREIIKHWWNEA